MQADLLLMKVGKSVRRTHLLEKRVATVTRVGVLAACVALLAVGGYVVANRQARQAREASAREAQLRQQAQLNAEKAQTETAKSRQVTQILKNMLQGVG